MTWPRNIWYRLTICSAAIWAIVMAIALLIAPSFVTIGLATGGAYPLIWLWAGYLNRAVWNELARMDALR